MTFTIEQLEALKEGITPGKWHATDEVGGSDLIIDGTGESLLAVGYVADGWASFTTVADGKLAAASPALLDQLIETIEINVQLTNFLIGVEVQAETTEQELHTMRNRIYKTLKETGQISAENDRLRQSIEKLRDWYNERSEYMYNLYEESLNAQFKDDSNSYAQSAGHLTQILEGNNA